MTFDDVRRIGLALPEVEEGTSFGTPALKVKGRLIARLRPEGEDLVVRIDLGDKEFLIETQPDVYHSTAHYEGYPAVLVRLASVRPGELGRILAASWRFVAPPRLRAAHPGV